MIKEKTKKPQPKAISTRIVNAFTGYEAEIKTKGHPSASTIRRHLGRAKAAGCGSVTKIWIEGMGYDFMDSTLVTNGER